MIGLQPSANNTEGVTEGGTLVPPRGAAEAAPSTRHYAQRPGAITRFS